MNPDENESQTPPFPPAPLPAPPAPAFDWRHWVRRLLVCNPFFLCSAALLLFGVNRLSLDPNFLGEEKSNLLFNYGALQLYEFLVVGTAIVLARRKIWYDSALLVMVEIGLLLVPFLLISQGALLNPRLGIGLAGGAVLLAAGRALAIRRGYPQFNLPPRALALGAGLLLLNAALPSIFPAVVELDMENWITPNLMLWFGLLPLLVMGANLLPRPQRFGGLNPERSWLPLFSYALLATGTGAHIWCLEYVSMQKLQIHFLAPAVFAAAWTLYRRLGDCVPEPGFRWPRALLGLAFGTPLLALGNPWLFELLVLSNAVIFAVLYVKGVATTRTVVRELLFVSLPFALIGLPDEFGQRLMPQFVRASAVVLGAEVLVCLCALRWFRLRLGIAGAVAMAAIVALLSPGAPSSAYVQVAVLFLLTHSLAWRLEARGAQLLRIVVGSVWLVNAAMWIHAAPWRTDLGITLSALLLLGAWFAIWRVSRQRPDLSLAAFAGTVTCFAPCDWLVKNGSPGLMALAASVFLFAIGFVVAWTRQHWEANGARR